MMPKAMIAACIVHALILSLVLVGFPVPIPREGAEFFYSGHFMPDEAIAGKKEAGAMPYERNKPIAVKAADATFFRPWVNLRSLNKPK